MENTGTFAREMFYASVKEKMEHGKAKSCQQ
jgi:hypothetical protein